jgi:hypothetical protein
VRVMIEAGVAQRRLVILWLAGSVPVLAIMLFRTFGPNSTDIERVWSWLLPSLMPTLSLVVGIYTSTAFSRVRDRAVDGMYFRLAGALSLAYLAILTLAIVFYPFSTQPALVTLDRIALVLGPAQGLVSAALGVFFVSQSRHAEPADGDGLTHSTTQDGQLLRTGQSAHGASLRDDRKD